jgi:hypothetical protein
VTPINKINDNEVSKLDTFYKNFRNNDNFKLTNWHEFSPDQTIQRIEKLFNGGYLQKDKKLNGVIQLFNTFNIRNQDLDEAVKYSNNKSKQMFSIGVEKYFNEKSTYFGLSKAVLENDILRAIAENISNNSTSKIKSIYKQKFE